MSDTTTSTFGPLVDTAWLAEHLHDPDLVILDATTGLLPGDRAVPALEAFERGHIPGARFLDLQKDLSDEKTGLRFSHPGAEDFARKAAAQGIGTGRRVVVYSTGGAWWATRVWWQLRDYGFDQAAILDGGFRKWQEEGRSVETGPAAPARPANFPASPSRGLLVGKEAVLTAVGDPAICTLNALPAPAHAGTVPPAKGRAGRIAGSVNLPALELIDPDTNTLRPLDQLRARFKAVGALDRDRVIAYCGGGIAATGDAFALTLLGHPDVVVYDASLQEWAQDPSLPMDSDPA